MGIKEKSEVESETWEKSETKLERTLDLEERRGKMDHHSKVFKLQAA